MPLKRPDAVVWEFGGFRLEPEKRLLVGDGHAVTLTSKAFDTLVVLVANRDRVVTKDELMTAVWPDVVVEEGNLTQQIFLLRKALGDSAQQPRTIVTVPGHGYRFTAPVMEHAPLQVPQLDIRPSGRSSRAWLLAGGVAGLVALIGVALLALWIKHAGDPWSDPRNVRITKVTETGKAINAALSPDGRFVAYVENDGDEYSLWVHRIATGGRTEVVPPQGVTLAHPAFTPDGEYLYFTSQSGKGGGFVLRRVPATGGPESPVLDNVDTPISFSPDGRQFAFMRGAGRKTHIVIAANDGTRQRILSSLEEPRSYAFVAPGWSPDGTIVAASVLDWNQGGRSSIVLLPIAGGRSRELYATDSRIGAPHWLRDGSALLTVVSETLSRQFPPWQSGAFFHFSGGPIWRIAYPSGRAERITNDIAEYDLCCTDAAADGMTVSGVVNSIVSDLWIAPANELDAPRQITWGTPTITRHSWMPDNDTVVYRDLAGRLSGVHRDGRTFSIQVPDGHKVAGGVSACGDGRFVVFQAVPGRSIWRVAPESGGATQLTSGSVDTNPVCSPDGRSVLYSSLRQNDRAIWRIPIDGGEPERFTSNDGFDALPSPTGRLAYYSAFEWEEQPERERHLHWIVVSVADGKRLFTLERPADWTPGLMPAWAPDESGLDYIVTRKGVSNIWRLPLAGGPLVQVTHFSAGEIFAFSWSLDGKWLSLASGMNRSDVVVLSRASDLR